MRAIIVLAAAAAFAAPAAAQQKGKSIEEQLKNCATCHGEDGNKPLTPDFPKLGGQHYDYLAHALKAYKSGARKNPIMAGQAKDLTTSEMEALAEYYSRQHSTLHIVPLHRLAKEGEGR
jgi:cytochrome c553